MDAIAPWLTPALSLALFTWLRRDLISHIDRIETRTDDFAREVRQRFDEVSRELAELRERMAKPEGSLEGFLSGLRGRAAA